MDGDIRYRDLLETGASVGARFEPSEQLLEYVDLTRQEIKARESAGSDESQWAEIAKRREGLVLKILKRPATSISVLFEKMYVWRDDCLGLPSNGTINFDEAFPLAVYLDLRKLVHAESFIPNDDEVALEKLDDWLSYMNELIETQ